MVPWSLKSYFILQLKLSRGGNVTYSSKQQKWNFAAINFSNPIFFKAVQLLVVDPVEQPLAPGAGQAAWPGKPGGRRTPPTSQGLSWPPKALFAGQLPLFTDDTLA